ncbi:MAG: hypothetical protein ACP5N3_04855 [Candidatus Nanoarchaeia archaeon]
MDKSSALERLNQDRRYEDKLAIDISEYFIDSLEGIKELTETEREKLKLDLGRIAEDSRMHSTLFTHLIELVLEHADDKY